MTPRHEPWVPHISLVFREMWDTTAPYLKALTQLTTKINVRGIPHLAKNERDVGHPGFIGEINVKGPRHVGRGPFTGEAVEFG